MACGDCSLSYSPNDEGKIILSRISGELSASIDAKCFIVTMLTERIDFSEWNNSDCAVTTLLVVSGCEGLYMTDDEINCSCRSVYSLLASLSFDGQNIRLMVGLGVKTNT